MALTLYAYSQSVYSQIVRMALHECGQSFQLHEVNPFTDPGSSPHPFGLVPVLQHGDFRVYETTAILRYLDGHFCGGRLTPRDAKACARMVQAQAIIDAHGYWPLVRQVFSNAVFRPLIGEPADAAENSAGLKAARVVLGELDALAADATGFNTGNLTLADIHLAPMIGFFALAPEGQEMLMGFAALHKLWQGVSQRASYLETRPQLPTPV